MAGMVQRGKSIDKDEGTSALSPCRMSAHKSEVECPATVSARSPSHTSTNRNEASRPLEDCSLDISTAAFVALHSCSFVLQLPPHSKTTA